MALLAPGFYPSTFHPKNYWVNEFWADYGTGTGWTKVIFKGIIAETGEFVTFVGKYKT